MAISKTFQAHTELKASDLNELKDQANAYVHEVDLAKPDTVDISGYRSEGAELPLANHYVYNGLPTEAFSGHCIETDDDYIAICNYHWDTYYSIFLYVKNNQDKYIFSSQFHNNEASTTLERFVADMIAGAPVTTTRNGVMTKEDKATFDEMVTEVFPLTVGVVSSNAGTYETGDNVDPQIVLSIKRKGVDVPASEITESISPTPAYVSPDKRTISGNRVTSGTTTYQIAVTQGGQTRSIPNQVFNFSYYRYRGALSSKPDTANIVAAIRALPKELSTVTTLGQTTLEANKYYLFAVKGNVTLIVKNAKSGGTIDIPNTDKGTCTVPQENGQGSNTYSWVIVPASSNTWYFQITNS